MLYAQGQMHFYTVLVIYIFIDFLNNLSYQLFTFNLFVIFAYDLLFIFKCWRKIFLNINYIFFLFVFNVIFIYIFNIAMHPMNCIEFNRDV